MTAHDYVVVGAGLTGLTVARCLADAGREVLVVERRSRVGGNVADAVDAETGVRHGLHGPHYFRTSSDEIWAFVRRFADWRPWAAEVLTRGRDGRLWPWPPTADSVRALLGERAEFWLRAAAEGRERQRGRPESFAEACLETMPPEIFGEFVRGYTEKQWGASAESLSASLAGRFDVRLDGERRLSRHRLQGLPAGGYSALCDSMTRVRPGGRRAFDVELGADWLAGRGDWPARKLTVFTGPVDEYFGARLGRLPYRGQLRAHARYAEPLHQPGPQVNNPGDGPHVRTIEWKHMLPPEERPAGATLVTREVPWSPATFDECEYPVPSPEADALHRRYRALALSEPRVLFAGRLGTYRYLDMDQAIGAALALARRVLERP